MNTGEKTDDIIDRLRALWTKHMKAEQHHIAESRKCREEARKVEAALKAMGHVIDVINQGEVIVHGGSKVSKPRGLTSTSLEAAKMIADYIKEKGPQRRKSLVDLNLTSTATIDAILASGAFRKEDGKMGRWMLIEQTQPATGGGHTIGDAAKETK